MKPFVSYDQSHDVVFTDEELQTEVWLPVVGFEDYYQISNLGRLRSLDRYVRSKSRLGVEYQQPIKGQLMSVHIDDFGYVYTGLCKEGKSYFRFIHRLVLESFDPCKDKLKNQINHKNYNRRDNRLINLEWCTVEQNNQYSYPNCFGKKTSSIPVTDLTTNKSYKSISSAVADFHYNHYETLLLCIERKKLFKGHVFICTEDLDSIDVDAYILEVIENSKKAASSSNKPIVDLTDNIRFETVRSACQYIQGTDVGMILAIQEKRPYKNHVFIYETQLDANFDTDRYITEAFDGYEPQKPPIAIKDLTTGIIYDSISQAAKILGVDNEKLRLCVRDQRLCDGHLFVKVEDLVKIKDESAYFNKIQKSKVQGRSIPILDITTGMEYESINQANTQLGINITKEHLMSHKLFKGHAFAYKYD